MLAFLFYTSNTYMYLVMQVRYILWADYVKKSYDYSLNISESNNFKGDFPKTQDIQDRLELSTKELGTLHAYYDSVSNPSETLPQKPDLSKMNDLDIAVHSLDLHLQAALLRYICILKIQSTLLVLNLRALNSCLYLPDFVVC